MVVTSIELRPLRRGEVDGLSRLLWRAFESDPLFRYLFRSRWYAGRVVPLLFGAQARDALRHGCIDVAVAHRQPLAAAIWLSPGQIFPPTTTGPIEPHWYLEALAVDPDRHGQGVGSHMLAFGLRRADEAGFACRLRTSNERNLALYGRFGFEVREETRPFKNGPSIWSMWRPAAAPRPDDGPEPRAREANRPIRSKGR